jgi:lysophospholipase L1-like esterase
VDVLRRSETWHGVMTVLGFDLAAGAQLHRPRPWPERKMLFLGDSVTCGEKIDRRPSAPGETPYDGWNAYLSYGMLVARALDAQCHLVCYGGRGLVRDWQGRSDVINATQLFDLAVPVEGDAPAWDHGSYDPDAVVISLGTNDFNLAIGPLPDREEFVSRYVDLVRLVRSHHAGAHIFLTDGAIVSDEADPARPQRTRLREHLSEVARRVADPRLHVVESRHYPGDATDGHPTLEQHASMAEDLTPVVRAALGW